MAMLRLIYPPTCILCGAVGDGGLDICAGCRADLPALGVACARCALPLPHAVCDGMPSDGPLCGGCRSRPPPFTRTLAAYRYEQPLPILVGDLKFRRRLDTLRLLGLLLGEALQASATERPDAIVPVPLHARRLRQRGYDQALELARTVGRHLDLPVLRGHVERVRSTPPQSGLDAKLRKTNLRNAFHVRRDLSGARIAILDDVVTTGSTVAEVARVLLGAGAHRVDVWCLARTP
jgi:ComF family protein